MRIVLSGPPGCGKGTQAELLVASHGMVHYSTGDVFRNHIRRQTPIGLKIAEYVRAGKLVPDAIVLEVTHDFLKNVGTASVLFDGFPRTIPQAQGLDRILDASGSKVDWAIFVDLADDIIVRRLTNRRQCRKCNAIYNLQFKPPRQPGVCDTCGGELYQREDDVEATIRGRLNTYAQETAGLKDYYRAQGKLQELDGSIGKERLAQAIERLLTATPR